MIGLCWWLIPGVVSPRSLVDAVLVQGSRNHTVKKILDGQLKCVIGASGGSLIIAGTAEVLLNHLARGMDPYSSVIAPRSYHQLIPNVLQYENWTVPTGDHFEVPAETRDALQKNGHVLKSIAGGTICLFILVQELSSSSSAGQLIGVSDPRKGGFQLISKV